VQNYANDVVAALVDACVLKGVAEPVIVSESGRALASHSSVLVFDVTHAPHHTMKPGPMDNVPEIESVLLRTVQTSNSQSQDAGEYLLSTFYQVHDFESSLPLDIKDDFKDVVAILAKRLY